MGCCLESRVLKCLTYTSRLQLRNYYDALEDDVECPHAQRPGPAGAGQGKQQSTAGRKRRVRRCAHIMPLPAQEAPPGLVLLSWNATTQPVYLRYVKTRELLSLALPADALVVALQESWKDAAALINGWAAELGYHWFGTPRKGKTNTLSSKQMT